jgi:hypothetical protein
MGTTFGVGRSGGKWAFQGRSGPGAGMVWRLHGIELVTANVNAVLKKMKLSGHAGLVSAANYVLTDADRGQSPKIPALTGTLRASRFAEPLTTAKGDPFVLLGYSANYAAAVHEMMISPSGKPIDWTRPGSGPKFLQSSLTRNASKITAIVAKHI